LVPHVVGVVTPTGTTTTGTLPGTVDVSSSAGSTAGFAATGTYMGIDPISGRGLGTANLTGGATNIAVVIYANRHRRFSVLDVQSIDPYVLGARLQ
jgi:hypothetical protein